MSAGVRLVRAGDAATLDHVLPDAFFDDPLCDSLLPDPDRRGAALRRGMGHVLRHTYVPRRGAWTTEELDGVALWGKAGRPSLSVPIARDGGLALR